LKVAEVTPKGTCTDRQPVQLRAPDQLLVVVVTVLAPASVGTANWRPTSRTDSDADNRIKATNITNPRCQRDVPALPLRHNIDDLSFDL